MCYYKSVIYTKAISRAYAKINSDTLIFPCWECSTHIFYINTFGTNRIVILVFSVDRDRLRERERQARAAMSIQAEQAAAGGGAEIPSRHHHHNHHNHTHHSNIHVSPPNLFRAPVRVNIFSIYSFSAIGEIGFFRHCMFLLYVCTLVCTICLGTNV